VTYPDGQPIKQNKDEWLKENPIYQDTFRCEKVFCPDFSLSHLHFHEFVEISIVAEGSGVLCAWNKVLQCRKGNVCIINADVPHGYFREKGEEPFIVRSLLFDVGDWFTGELSAPASPRYCYGVFDEDILTAHVSLKSRSLENVERIYQMLESEIQEKNPEWKDVVKSHLTVLLITMGRYLEESRSLCPVQPKDRMLVSSAMRTVTEHYSDRNLTLEKIADSLFVSKSHLSKLFHRDTGGHFHEYLRSVRLNQACRLLKETQLTNEQIVYECGMKDLPSFYRLFKSQFSMTPSQYRAETQNKAAYLPWKPMESMCQSLPLHVE